MLTVGAIQILILFVALVRGKVLSVTLGPAGYGVLATIDQLVLALLSLGTLGLPFASLKFMAKGHSQSQHAFEQTYSGFLWALILLGLVTTTIGAGLGFFAPDVFGSELGSYGPLIAIAMLGVPAAMANMLLANALAAAQKGPMSAAFTLAVQALLLVATIVGVYAAGTTGIYVTTVAVGTLTTFTAIFALRKTLGSPHVHGFGWLTTELKRDWTVMIYSGWSWLATAVYTVSLAGVRTSVFSGLGAVEAGLLQAALSLALTVGAVINPVSNLILAPFLNRSMPIERKVTAANDFAMKVLALLLVGALPLVLFPRSTIGLLFAREFFPAAGILFAFILWQCLAQLVNVYTQLLVGLDDVSMACAFLAVGYGAAFLIAPQMASLFGLLGAAISLVAGVTSVGIANVVRLQRKHHVSTQPKIALRLAFTLTAVAIPSLALEPLPETSALGLATRLATALVILGIQWLLLNDGERRWATSGFRKGRKQ